MQKICLPRYGIVESRKSIQDIEESQRFAHQFCHQGNGKSSDRFIAKDNIEVFNDPIQKVFNHFKLPLKNAGLDGTISDVLGKWHSVIDYTVAYLNLGVLGYGIIWHQLFVNSCSSKWIIILLMTELVFALLVWNTKVERLFPFMIRVKTDARASFGEKYLNSLLRISLWSPWTADSDPMLAMCL